MSGVAPFHPRPAPGDEGIPYPPPVTLPIAFPWGMREKGPVHELAIATSMLETVLEQTRRSGAGTVAVVTVRIGDLAGVVTEALEFAWEAVSGGTPAEGARLEVERVALACYCATCRQEFEAADRSYRCPGCGGLSADLRRGRELNLVSIEVN